MRQYSYLMNATGPDTGHYVELEETKFIELLQSMLALVEVDEAWYRERYADVDEAIKSGALKSCREHYMLAGYFENRIPRPLRLDERWYLTTYPDVAGAIKSGAFANATEHFHRDGFREGRLPVKNWSLIGTMPLNDSVP